MDLRSSIDLGDAAGKSVASSSSLKVLLDDCREKYDAAITLFDEDDPFGAQLEEEESRLILWDRNVKVSSSDVDSFVALDDVIRICLLLTLRVLTLIAGVKEEMDSCENGPSGIKAKSTEHPRSSPHTLPRLTAPVLQVYTLPATQPEPSISSGSGTQKSGSVPKSPHPTIDDLSIIPPGAFLSPPDSPDSSGDEHRNVWRGRDLCRLEEELKEAIKNLPQRCTPSSKPQHETVEVQPIDVAARSRNDSHSNSDSEDAAHRIAPALIRKKGGDVVKPSLKLPVLTPAFPKSVHFDSRIENIRYFLHSEKPSAVSVEPLPFGNDDEKPQWEISLPNFPKDLMSRKNLITRLEKLCLSFDQKNLIGTVAVATLAAATAVNLEFQKDVVVRFTFDYWQTVSEVSAELSNDSRQKELEDGVDRFVFIIKLAEQVNLEKKTLFFSVRYSSAGQEHWDNNGGLNFQVDFKKTSRNPNARTTPVWSRSMSEFDLDDDFYGELGSDRLNSKSKIVQVEEDTTLPARRANPAGNHFGNRYDFRNSFHAALKAKPTTRSKMVPIWDVTKVSAETSSTVPLHSPSISDYGPPEIFSTDKFWTHEDKPSIESPSYRELLDNYCFFGSSKATKLGSKPEGSSKASLRTEAERKTEESLRIFLPGAGSDRCASPQFITSPLNVSVTSPSLSVEQQRSTDNWSPIPLNCAEYRSGRKTILYPNLDPEAAYNKVK
ncbi:hypothetical protein K440DRAFT_659177 [Wilcoxina mikolae CBS 423.85]|nr:hypothetical protein K440DRAFT_659177 [Wilcoxina mikolae CBS 423.85]